MDAYDQSGSRTRLGALAGVLCAVLLTVAPAAGAADRPDADRGRLLYENHCVVCHTSKVHRRIPALVIDREELRRIVGEWSREAKLRWTATEIEDVTQYLEGAFYRPARR